jgi:glutamate-1-semialdehyde 2,1-aminomutase
MDETFASAALALGALALLPAAKRRLELSRAKHRSLAGHSRWAKRLAALIPGYAYDEARFFDSDDAPALVAQQRRVAFDRLAAVFEQRFPISAATTARAREAISDLQFTGRYRVPFQYAPLVRERLRIGAFAHAADGVMVEDLDGNRFFDLTGSYGVNVFGTDFYRECIDEGAERARALGPVLGNLHPMTLANAERLKEISGLDEVSFHMSGTEAVMQAVRLARYHTRRKYLVRFCGAYHGWWEDVQPGPGNPLPPRETYTLRDMHERSLQVLRTRRDIACVLVNPLQALHPNAGAPADSQLIDGSRRAAFDREAYTAWLKRLREVCTERGIVLIFDEVFVGFRLAPGGAQEYFGVRADMVTYGKTLGGGLPVGVVCGKREWMKRYREARPADICFARGTFNSHPYVMGAMAAFLDRLQTPEVAAIYNGLDARWNARAEHLNWRLREAGVPVQVANLSSIWTVTYTQPGRYHWMLQFYLRAQGLALSWVGTGRLIFSLNYGDAEFDAVAERFVEACVQMQADGWWWSAPSLTAKSIKRGIFGEMLRLKF